MQFYRDNYYIKSRVSKPSHYTTFGSSISEMQFSSYTTRDYRFGFNGIEKWDCGCGEDFYSATFRQFDSRIGRWFSVDPIKVPWESPYAAMRNNPILFADKEGDCPDCPKDAAVGDIYINNSSTEPYEVAINGDFINIDKGSVVLYRYYGIEGGWRVLSFQNPSNGTTYNWTQDKNWYTDKSGNEFDADWEADLLSAATTTIKPLVDLTTALAYGKDPFAGIKEEYGNYDGNLASFVWTMAKNGVTQVIDDVGAGGHRRSQAVLTIWLSWSASGANKYLGVGTTGMVAKKLFKLPDEINIDSKQLGKKWGAHKGEWPEIKTHNDYKAKIQQVYTDPNAKYTLGTGNYEGEILIESGNDLLRVDTNGNFISLYNTSSLTARALKKLGKD